MFTIIIDNPKTFIGYQVYNENTNQKSDEQHISNRSIITVTASDLLKILVLIFLHQKLDHQLF